MRPLLSVLPVLALLGLGAAPAHAIRANIAIQPVSRMDTPWWHQRFAEKQAAIAHGRFDVVWLGDSITQNWERNGPEAWRDFAPTWQRYYGDRHAINLGFKGDSTCHVLWRLAHGELDFRTPPRLFIVLIGANNFGHVHTDAGLTYPGIVRIVDTIHARFPSSRVLLLGVLPSIRSAWITANTQQLNRTLHDDIGRGRPWLRYMDAGATVERDGAPDRSRFLDPHLTPPDPPLHPTAPAQEAIARMIEPAVADALGDHRH
ncbi:acetylhydrolase [Gluconacetobacter azotocaptans]|uniref:Acetylhydrolase n=1 Tax=Gluconacetobacter azotocaptans TaxID=142834 RepID=A0A7W4PEL8_9PROT|nr:GDSL-type esterase/lipase family protein [Gluconacetobacter azotocaptans]MBB2190680.1 acetylhydrolase [Gluconacetobacter azotocaptans]GBQ30399.1 putative acetylhydrolase [Gluconacetobacter azotocaptans DSM 13594]